MGFLPEPGKRVGRWCQGGRFFGNATCVFPRTKPSELSEEIAVKVRDTLAGLVCTKVNGRDETEKVVANEALQQNQIRVVVHLEQPRRESRIKPLLINPANLKLKLKQLIKAVDPHPDVVDRRTLKNTMPWNVTSINQISK
ncbi:hypothetical protein [Acanthopleuribacter pedis]|uniref:Uncharacterized protein n=1 Tax=Acanthopleuribacter pedis TaxID=442870 RepID=A0A8J7QK89_9BACT|nr:hypothetical protein [Acanthopleuribacter pedis]MBO1319733.1 hypothetical protein [Acanthopleuribacter pedis]